MLSTARYTKSTPPSFMCTGLYFIIKLSDNMYSSVQCTSLQCILEYSFSHFPPMNFAEIVCNRFMKYFFHKYFGHPVQVRLFHN